MKAERRKKRVENGKWKVGNMILFVLFLLSACASGEGIEAHEAWVRNAKQGEITVIYMTFHNHTDVDDALVGISTEIAEIAELHLSKVNNDVMTMTPQEQVMIPARGEAILESGGYHIMLINLKQDLNIGDEITVTLHFEKYQDVTITVPVKDSAEENQSHP